MKTIALVLALTTAGAFASASALASTSAAAAQAKPPCRMTFFIQAAEGAPAGMSDPTANLFLYGLRSAVERNRGCIVGKMTAADLGLYVTTLKLPGANQPANNSVVAVALAVPLHGVPVYIDDYVFMVRDTDNIEAQVNTLLESIGATLSHHGAQAQ